MRSHIHISFACVRVLVFAAFFIMRVGFAFAQTKPDLVTLNVTLSKYLVAPGENVIVSFRIANQGNANAGATTTQIRLNQAAARPIPMTPVLTNVSAPGLAAGTYIDQSAQVTIPLNTSPGTYYVWVIADNAGVIAQSNVDNDFARSSAVAVQNPALSDLVVQNLTVNPTSGLAGTNATVSFRIYNQGSGTASASTTRIRYSEDASLTTADPLLSEFSTNSIAAGSWIDVSKPVTIPNNANPGGRFMGVTVDVFNTANQSNIANDQALTGFTVTSAKSDLIVQNLSVNPTSGLASSDVTMSFRIYNQGSGAANASTTRIRYSEDASLTTADPLLSEFSTNSIAAGSWIDVSKPVTIPNNANPGGRFMGVTVDVFNTANQSNIANDQALTGFTVNPTPTEAKPVITNSLSILESPPYKVGQTVTATFTITNKGSAPISFDVLTVGGRLNGDESCSNVTSKPNPNTQCADFTWVQNIILNPGQSYNYQGTITFAQPGGYHFFTAYRLSDGITWNPNIPTEPAIANTVDLIVTSTQEQPYPSGKTVAPYPIIFVHGIDGSDETFKKTMDYLNGANSSGIFWGPINVFDVVLNADNNKSTSKFEQDVQWINFNSNDRDIKVGPRSYADNPDNFQDGWAVSSIFAVNFKEERIRGAHINIITNDLFDESNEASIFKQGYALKAVITEVLAYTGAKKVILVGHSMGGLAIREYLQRKDSNGNHRWWFDPTKDDGHRVAKAVTIGTPHYGFDHIYFAHPSPFPKRSAPSETQSIFPPNLGSEAMRDMSIQVEDPLVGFDSNGPYLFSGFEKYAHQNKLSNINFHNSDINCDGDEDDYIIGLNSPNIDPEKIKTHNSVMSLPSNVAYKWIVATGPSGNHDDVVSASRQYLDFPGDTIREVIGWLAYPLHIQEGGEYKAIIRGLDEPKEHDLAYQIELGKSITGFITLPASDSNPDKDLYKAVSPTSGILSVTIDGVSAGTTEIAIYDANQSLLNGARIGSFPFKLEANVNAGVYYIEVSGNATSETWKNPYSLTVTHRSNTTDNPPAVTVFKVEPSSVTLGNAFKISYTVSDDIGLKRVELWRTNDVNGAPNSTWPGNPIQILPLSSQKSYSDFFSDTPTVAGTYWYGIHVVDTKEQVSHEPQPPGPSKVIIGNSPSSKTLVVDPDLPVEFGTITINTPNDKTITLQNIGTQPLRVTSLAISGANADQFFIISPTSTAFEIAAQASQQVTIRFRPTTTGDKSATLNINNDSDNAGPTKTINLSGIGTTLPVKTLVVIPDPTLDFENVMINNSREKILTLQNTRTAALKVTGLTITGTSAGNFTFVDPPSTPFVISAGATRQVKLRFGPIATGVATVLLHISHDADNDGPMKVIYLTGTGTTTPSKILVFDPDPSWDFGNVTLNTKGDNIFTLQNAGTEVVTITNLTINGINADQFSMKSVVGINFSIYPGKSGQVTIHFQPVSLGSKSATLVINNDSDNSGPIKSINLVGNGVQLPNDPFLELPISLTDIQQSSVAWGDYNNDGALDILLTGHDGLNRISQVYQNNNGGFQPTSDTFLQTSYGSAAWGDFDNDGYLDILLSGIIDSDPFNISKIYRNDNKIFQEHPASLAGTYHGSSAWGDYDNDGDLDILLTGASDGGRMISKIYRNDSGSFMEISTSLEGVQYSSVAWGDFDSDGDLDILLTGQTASGTRISKVYRNDSGSFFNINVPLTGVDHSSVAWGDYNNDGKLDILLTGFTGALRIAKIYRNTGTSFEDISAALTGVSSGSAAWGDYDNDGDLDVLLTGNAGGLIGHITKVYRNDEGTFTEISTTLQGVMNSAVAWGDYDNDRDLDILLTGATGKVGVYVTKIYRNNIIATNSVPTPPSNLTSSLTVNAVTLNWSKATDSQTAQNALTYNLRIGKTPGGVQIFSPMANAATGYRKVSQLGNTNHRNSWTIKDLSPGTYYWSVQAIDNAFAGSAFASEQSFTITNNETTPLPATAAYGNIPSGDRRHKDKVTYSFEGGIGHMFLSYQAYDIDNRQEVDILLNGIKVIGAPKTQNNQWSGNRGVFLHSNLINDTGSNLVEFDNTKNPPEAWVWGVRQVAVERCFGLPSVQAYGKIPGGDRKHPDRVIYWFPGQIGDMNLSYEVYDIDSIHELNILLNGKKIHDEAVTADNTWSKPRTLLLPDTLINDKGPNVLIFDNTKNPPQIWSWGVRNVNVEPTSTFALAVDLSHEVSITGNGMQGIEYLFDGEITFPDRFEKDENSDGDSVTTSTEGITTIKPDGHLLIGFPTVQRLDYLLLYPEENPQRFFCYQIEVSLDGQNWNTLVDKTTAPMQGTQFDQIPGTQTRFLRISGFSYICDVESLETEALDEESYWEAYEETIKKAERMDLAITELVLFKQESLTTVVTEETPIPTRFVLEQNYPNPFNPSTVISFQLPVDSEVNLSIYNLNGQLVKQAISSKLESGKHQVVWDGTDERGVRVSSGVYVYSLKADSFIAQRKLVLVK